MQRPVPGSVGIRVSAQFEEELGEPTVPAHGGDDQRSVPVCGRPA